MPFYERGKKGLSIALEKRGNKNSKKSAIKGDSKFGKLL